MGEGTEEGLQEGISIATDRVAKKQGSGSKADILKEAVDFSAYTDEDKKQIWESAKAGAIISGVGAGTKATSNAVINKIIGEPAGKGNRNGGENVVYAENGQQIKYDSISFDGEQREKSDTGSLVKKIWNKRKDVISGENAFDVDESSIEKAETPSMGIFNLFKKWGEKVINPELGAVELNKKGAKNTVLHGIGKRKYIASAAIKDVIEKGKIIDKQENWKGRGYDTYIIAAEGNVDGKKSIVGVVVKSYPSGKMNNKFYLHEVIQIGENSPATATDENISVTNADEFSPNAETSNNEVSEDTISQEAEKVKVSGVELGENGRRIYGTMKAKGDKKAFDGIVAKYYQMGLKGIGFDKARDMIEGEVGNPPTDRKKGGLGEEDARRIHNAGMKDGARKREGGVVASAEIRKRVGDKTVSALNRIARKLHIIIDFAETLGNENGLYENGRITIALDSDKPYIIVASHEITHHIKATASKAVWDKFQSIAVSYEAKKAKMSSEELIREKIKSYKAAGKNINKTDAMEEIAADFTSEVFKDDKELQEFLQRMSAEGQENKRAIEKFFDSIKAVFEKIGELIPHSDRVTLENAIKKFEKAYNSAIENTAQGKTPESGKVKYDVKMDFKHQVDASLDGKLRHTLSIFVGKVPNLLTKCGLDGNLPMLMNQSHLKDIIHPKSDKNIHWHGLSRDTIKQIPEQLKNPVMIYDSISEENSENSICVVTNLKDDDGLPIIISIKANSEADNKYLDISLNEMKTNKSNFITSTYGKDNFFNHINEVIEKDALLFANKNKTLKLFAQKGLQLPERLNNLGFDNIIHQSRNIVNSNSMQKNEKYSQEGKASVKGASNSDIAERRRVDNGKSNGYNKRTKIKIPHNEALQLQEYIMHQNNNGEELREVGCKSIGNNFYIWHNNNKTDYTVTQKIKIDGNEEKIRKVRKGIQNGTYGERRILSGMYNGFSERYGNGDRSSFVDSNRSSTRGDDKVSSGKSSGRNIEFDGREDFDESRGNIRDSGISKASVKGASNSDIAERRRMETENQRLEELYRVTEEQNINADGIEKFTESFMKYTSTTAEKGKLMKEFAELLRLIKSKKGFSEIKNKALEIARELVENASALNDGEYVRYKGLRDFIRKERIAITEEIKDEFKGEFEIMR